MNDFTKEELLSIIDAFKWIKDDPAWRNKEGWDDELEVKIRDMIANCKHESDGMCYTAFPPLNKCVKCGEFYR